MGISLYQYNQFILGIYHFNYTDTVEGILLPSVDKALVDGLELPILISYAAEYTTFVKNVFYIYLSSIYEPKLTKPYSI